MSDDLNDTIAAAVRQIAARVERLERTLVDLQHMLREILQQDEEDEIPW